MQYSVFASASPPNLGVCGAPCRQASAQRRPAAGPGRTTGGSLVYHIFVRFSQSLRNAVRSIWPNSAVGDAVSFKTKRRMCSSTALRLTGGGISGYAASTLDNQPWREYAHSSCRTAAVCFKGA